ncbi:MAG: GNAT family N-acetyltransferase [Acidobacteria bacterium]|nr:GNAT family N-acetyltransferase [Acidobacteriota bacterium]MBV9068034.1 GNAT family N-acetyltransferase [Acidobacteriota bacterium]MBV9185663.1 GNAT family N-acetyltransferase [Acidobacteriota bacterium]
MSEVITDLESLEALAPAWIELCRKSEVTPFQTPMWLLPWWRNFGSNDLSVIVSREGERVDAIAPLYILRDDESDESLGMFLGTGISDYLDVVGDAKLIIDEMSRLNCQLWDLQQLQPSSSMLTAPLPDGFSENVEDQEACPVLPLFGKTFENLGSTHFQKKLRYYRRALERTGEVRIETPAAETLDDLLTALFDLHAARWKRRNLPGVLADDASQAFHRDAARRMLDAGMLRMYATRIDDRIVAVFYGFALNGIVYYYLSGYDPGLEKLSIGTILVAHAIEQAVHDGATAFDFLRGAEEYKYAWGATDRMNRRRQLFKG